MAVFLKFFTKEFAVKRARSQFADRLDSYIRNLPIDFETVFPVIAFVRLGEGIGLVVSLNNEVAVFFDVKQWHLIPHSTLTCREHAEFHLKSFVVKDTRLDKAYKPNQPVKSLVTFKAHQLARDYLRPTKGTRWHRGAKLYRGDTLTHPSAIALKYLTQPKRKATKR